MEEDMHEITKNIYPAPSARLELPTDVHKLPNGNVLVADGGYWTGDGSEIIEIDLKGNIVWTYDKDLSFAHGARILSNGNMVIVDTGNNRLVEVTRKGEEVWSSDEWDNGTGQLSDGSHLDYPNDVEVVENENFLVTDRNNNRAVEVNRNGVVIRAFNNLNHPHNADPSPKGTILVASSDDNVVMELSRDGDVLWTSEDKLDLSWPRDFDWVDENFFLIADSRHHRVLIVDRAGNVEWAYVTERLSQPYDADYLPNGNVLFSDQRHFRLVELNPGGNIVWSFCNFFRTTPIYENLANGCFERLDQDTGAPIGWLRCLLNAEGMPKFFVDASAGKEGRTSLVLKSSGKGAVWWQQTVDVVPGKTYGLSGNIRCVEAAGGAAIQVAFLDTYGGFIHEVKELPGTKSISDTTDWVARDLEIEAPKEATAADIRLVLMGQGTAWFDDINFDLLAWV
jgi:hypothetical protein